ncbi:hypothetical protein C9374_004890 [Naegleria lovaniensis]|uniref:F-box domain-containing protein n=1 Tax=Naegleria lovaniensis TaxID=51637 RepID=A0AA88KKF1_NAELO|nr:uncharacterized protein C9374_004890 [Naegleria lovaniensis]KAG2382923.1 hypothetical protein C9374_004890 [Naegleria lovaniensis]
MKRKMPQPKSKASRGGGSAAASSLNTRPKKVKKAQSHQAEILQSSDLIMQSILSCFELSEVLNEMAFISSKFYQVSRSEKFWSGYNVWASVRDPPPMFYANLFMKCFGASWTSLTLSSEALLSDSFKRRNNQVNLPNFKNLHTLEFEWSFDEVLNEKENNIVLSNLVDLLCQTPSLTQFNLKLAGESIPNFSSNALDGMKKALQGSFKFKNITIILGGVLEGENKNIMSEFVSNLLTQSSSTLESLIIRSVGTIDAQKYLKSIKYPALKNIEIKLVERIRSTGETSQAIQEIIMNNADHLESIQVENDEGVSIVSLVSTIMSLSSQKKLTKLKKLIFGGSDNMDTLNSTEIQALTNALPSLETLVIKDILYGTWLRNFLQSTVQHSNKLKVFKLKGIEPSESNGYIDECLEGLVLPTSITKFSLKRTPVTNQVLKQLLSGGQYSNLKALSYGTEGVDLFYINDSGLNEDTLSYILPLCPRLESLWVCDSMVKRLLPIVAKFTPNLLSLSYQCLEFRGRELVENYEAPSPNISPLLSNLMSLELLITCSNDELSRILSYTPNIVYLQLLSSNLSGQVIEVLSESKCASKLVGISLIDPYYEEKRPCICDAEKSELKQQNFKLANMFKRLETLEYSIGHHLISLKLMIAIVCYSPSLEEVILNGRNVLEGVDMDNLCMEELVELIESHMKKKKKHQEVDEFSLILDITVPRITDQLKVRQFSKDRIEDLLETSVALVSGEIAERVEYQGISLIHHLLLNALNGDDDEQEEQIEKKQTSEDEDWEDDE